MDGELETTFGTRGERDDLNLEEFLKAITARDVRVRPKKGRRLLVKPTAKLNHSAASPSA